MSHNTPAKHQTTWLLDSSPNTWVTKYSTTPTPSSDDPFAFDHLVKGERILDLSYQCDGYGVRQTQWSSNDATGIDVQPPPKFPIVEDLSGNVQDDVLSEWNNPELLAAVKEIPALASSDSQTEDNVQSFEGEPQDNADPTAQDDDEKSDTSEDSYVDDWDDDICDVEPLSNEPIPHRSYPEPPNNTQTKHRLDTLKQFVAAQLELPQSSRVDTIIFDDPAPTELLAIDGLSFKHLVLKAGVIEEVDLTAVAQLTTPWKSIESVRLVGVCSRLIVDRRPSSGSEKEQWTAIPPSIKTLQLDLATSSFDFMHPEGGLHSLQNLKLVDNYAVDLFCKAWRQLPNFISKIQVLHIISTNGCDLGWYRLEDFRRRLRASTNVKTLLIALAKKVDIDINLADFIPPSVENLSFHFTKSDAMLQDLDTWIERARDPGWLPNLKCIKLGANAEWQGYKYQKYPHLHGAYIQDPRFEEKIQDVIQALLQRNPPIKVVV
ncbi:hypothetical protein CVT24_000936 [Panaeolus cyanescens]|uniref:Uncharacterized protein n=1 Tax=Panaeolus cyanescens TaxID=181874 RepID=A0A409YTC8_9AGAR|nr:hypothetical protein CVT24_000936 [Panaeolus cyanescens]